MGVPARDRGRGLLHKHRSREGSWPHITRLLKIVLESKQVNGTARKRSHMRE